MRMSSASLRSQSRGTSGPKKCVKLDGGRCSSALAEHAHVSQAGLIAYGVSDGFEAKRFIEPDGGPVPRPDIQLKASISSTVPGSQELPHEPGPVAPPPKRRDQPGLARVEGVSLHWGEHPA